MTSVNSCSRAPTRSYWFEAGVLPGLLKSQLMLLDTPTEPSTAEFVALSRPSAFCSALSITNVPDTGELEGSVLHPGAPSA